jgi:hypothetical protein
VQGGLGFDYNGGLVDFHGTGWDSDGIPTATPPGRDPSKSQARVRDEDSVTPAGRAAAGRRKRLQTKDGILRGQLTVGNERHHPDGWDIGQIMGVKDRRLPGMLNNRSYIIQRVILNLVPTQNWRVYDLEWGDAPIGRDSTRHQKEAKDAKAEALPARIFDIAYRRLTPLVGSTETIVGQLVDESGNPKRQPNVTVKLGLEIWLPTNDTDIPDQTITAGTGADGSFLSDYAPVTDIMGTWQTNLTVGSTAGYGYEVVTLPLP